MTALLLAALWWLSSSVLVAGRGELLTCDNVKQLHYGKVVAVGERKQISEAMLVRLCVFVCKCMCSRLTCVCAQ